MRIHKLSLMALVLLGSAVALAAPKDNKNKRGDVIWIHPEFASRGIQSIAMMPVASYDNNFKGEKTVENLLSVALRPSGYRWISPVVTKEILRSSVGESTITALDKDILKNGRVDSVAANRLCRRLRVTALLSARLDLYEQMQVEWNQSGKPSTTVQVRIALVDSTGQLVWSAAGSETAEGPYHDPNAGTMGVKGSGLNTEPVAAQSGAPSFEDVSTRLFTRWAAHFPAFKPAEAPAAPAEKP